MFIDINEKKLTKKKKGGDVLMYKRFDALYKRRYLEKKEKKKTRKKGEPLGGSSWHTDFHARQEPPKRRTPTPGQSSCFELFLI